MNAQKLPEDFPEQLALMLAMRARIDRTLELLQKRDLAQAATCRRISIRRLANLVSQVKES